MLFAIELYFDATTDTTVRQIWKAIADAGISSSMLQADYRPHVSLGVCHQLDAAQLGQALSSFAKTLTPFPVSLSSIGIFPSAEGVIFLGVTVTQQLLQAHAAFHQIFERYTSNQSEVYRIGAWVPHCTLAFGLSSDRLAEAVAACWHTPLPIQGYIKEIGLVEVSPTHCRTLYSHNLGTLNK